ncbi:hypothetical protein DFH28DRAFT_1196584 [Melampsora americana]|nr:hypothetical protein DFH28DRAFT_1196584 [Melampsora americana]
MNFFFWVWLMIDLVNYSRSEPLRSSTSHRFQSFSISPCELDLSISKLEHNNEVYQSQSKTSDEKMNQILEEVSRVGDFSQLASKKDINESRFQRVKRYGELRSPPVGSRPSSEQETDELSDTQGALDEMYINLKAAMTEVDRYLEQLMKHSPCTRVRAKRKVSSTKKITSVSKRTLQARQSVQNKNRSTDEPLVNNKATSVVSSSVQDAVKTIKASMNRFDEIADNFRDSKVPAVTLQKAAEEGLVIETGEGIPRQVLASSTSNPEAAQSALAVIRDEGPKIVARVVLATKNLIGGIIGGDKNLISEQLFSPSLNAIGNKLNLEQRKAVDRSQKELEAKIRSIDTQMLILRNKSSTPTKLKAAATSALALEAEQTFHREVLVSAASDSKAAISALREVTENVPKVISGLISIIRNNNDETKVQTSLHSIIEGRSEVVRATWKLIQLTLSSSQNRTDPRKEDKKTNVTISKTPLIEPKNSGNKVKLLKQDDKKKQEDSKPVTAHNHQHSIPIHNTNLSQPTNATSNDLRQLLSSQLTEYINNGTPTKKQS